MPVEDKYLERAGGSLATFVGTALANIEDAQYKRRMDFAVFFLAFLEKLKELGVDPENADQVVKTFMLFADRPQFVTGGELQVGGAIENMDQTELGVDLKINFSVGGLALAGGIAQGGIEGGLSYRTFSSQTVKQNFSAIVRWEYAAGPILMTQEDFSAITAAVLKDPTITIPVIAAEDFSNPIVLMSKLLPFLAATGVSIG